MGAAQLLRLPSGGRLDVKAPADLIVVKAMATCPYDTLVSASRADVRLSMIDGKPAIAEPALQKVFAATSVSASDAVLDGAPRRVAKWIADHVSQMRLQEPGFQVH
jgi:hypothetical protein